MFCFFGILWGVLFSFVFFVDRSTSIQGFLTGSEDYIRLHWDDYNPKYFAKIYCHGAHIVSWLVNGTDYLFLSNNTIFNDKNPLIGGIPSVFPVYGDWQFGKDNGFLKAIRWDIWDPPMKDWETGIWNMTFKIRDLVYTRHMWNYHFLLYSYITINKNILTMTLKLTNTEDTKPFHFKLGFRNHIRVPDVTKVTVKGLIDVPFLDNTIPQKLNGKPERFLSKEDVRITNWTDRLYPSAPNEVIVTNLEGGKSLKISYVNFPDVAVWHPWNDHYRPEEEFINDEYKHFIGIHGGILREYQKLGPNETYEATQIFELL